MASEDVVAAIRSDRASMVAATPSEGAGKCRHQVPTPAVRALIPAIQDEGSDRILEAGRELVVP